MCIIICMKFEWDEAKNKANIAKHAVSFKEATKAFSDKKALTAYDSMHSTETESRYNLIGKVGDKIMTVSYTIRDEKIRIISAGYYRKGRRIYEKRNSK